MKTDQAFLRRILEVFVEHPRPTIDIDILTDAGFDLNDDQFVHHLESLYQRGLIEQPDGDVGIGLYRGLDGHISWSAVQLRATVAGEEFLEQPTAVIPAKPTPVSSVEGSNIVQLLKATLERVRAGETRFEPTGSSEKELDDFQKVANCLLEAKSQGLIHDVKVMKDNSRGSRPFRIAIVVGGLTFPGDKFLESKPAIVEELTKSGASLDVFISHSTEDTDVAASFIALLRAALPIDPTRIRCTSVEGFRLPAGSSFNDQLRAEVFESTILVALLSPASLNSIYTLFELGARWGTQKYLAPVLIRGTKVSALKQPLAALNAISSSSEVDVSQLISKIAELLRMQSYPHHSYATSLRTFCEIG